MSKVITTATHVTKRVKVSCSIALFACFSVLSFTSNAATYLYVSNSESNNISIFEVVGQANKTSLQLVDHINIDNSGLSGPSTPMAYSSKRKTLYVASRHDNAQLAQFDVSPTSGKLTIVDSVPLQHSYAHIALDNTQNMLVAASYPQNLVRVMSLNAKGNVAPHSILSPFPKAHAVAFSPSNLTVFVPSLGNDRVNRFSVSSSDVQLFDSQFTQFPAGSGPRHLAFHPNGHYLYVVGELDAKLYTLKFDEAKGSTEIVHSQLLLSVSNTSQRDEYKAADIEITENGKFLYATERETNSVCGFQINNSGDKPEKIECIETEERPRGIQIDKANSLLIVAGQRSHHISLYKIESTGKLSFIDRYSTGKGPNWIEVVSFED